VFLRNCWYVAGWSHHFAADALVARTILGEPIVLYRKRDGGVVALEDRCCHRLAPLSRGRREGDDLRCMYHGLKFAPSGKCIEIPQQEIIPSTAVVRSYPSVEQDCWVWLWMGDPASRAERCKAVYPPPANDSSSPALSSGAAKSRSDGATTNDEPGRMRRSSDIRGRAFNMAMLPAAT